MRILRNGFSMIELILVMVVLGIVASISSTLIAKVYESYIIQRAMYRASVSTELVATQLVNRLTYAIGSSIIAREPGTNNIDSIQDLPGGTALSALEWIGYDNDSFSATTTPGWSSYCDVNRSTKTLIQTPGSILTGSATIGSATSIIGYLGAVGAKGSTINTGAIIFSGGEYSTTKLYDPSCMGYTGVSTCISRISSVGATSITIADNNAKILTDRYKLAWSAYAVVPENLNADRGTYDLVLYSNYQPWENEGYVNGDKNLLATNVTQFKFFGQGSTLRFKICIREEIGLSNADANDNLGICKEKVVIK